MSLTAYRSTQRSGRDGLAQLVRAEWTKFRTVRGWLVALVVVAGSVLALGLMTAEGSHSSCSRGTVEVSCPSPPTGPDGEAVADKFYFVHQSLTGDGSITVRLTSMTGIITYPPPNHDTIIPRVEGWAGAGLMVKASTRPGASYAAVMATGGHGVRMQDDFVHSTAGPAGAVTASTPRWLRLVRTGGTITGYASTDGTAWRRVGTAHPRLADTVQVGLFVNSPGDLSVKQGDLGGSSEQFRFTQATGVFDRVTVAGGGTGDAWQGSKVGGGGDTDWERLHRQPGVVRSGDQFTVTGSGEISPSTDGLSVERTLTGLFIGMIVVIVVAVLFLTSEYRRGLIRTSLLASPRRGRVLAAKAVVIGVVTFVVGLVAAAITVPICVHVLRANGNYILPVSTATELRVIVGVAAMLGVSAVFALAVGSLVRRSAVAVIIAMAALVLPQLLATTSFLPDGVARWLLRVTPAAGFAIQQSIPEYPQVIAHYAPVTGYYPLPPWAGFAVLCGFTAALLALAVRLLNRRDA